jgi:hypothetical protein
MGFFQNIFGSPTPKPPAAPVAPGVLSPPVPSSLPKIAAPTAAPVCQQYKPAPPARDLLTPAHTPPQYLTALRQQQLPEESVKFLAYGLPEREAVWWAVQCAQKVSSPANQPDQAAIKAADAWVKNPSPATQKAAGDAAAQSDFKTPGPWAAQAAAWVKTPPPPGPVPPPPPSPVAAVPPNPPPPRLCPHAVVGAVMLAVAIQGKKLSPLPGAPLPAALAAPVPPTASGLAGSGAGMVAKAAAPGLASPGTPASPVAGAAGNLAAMAAPGGGMAPAGVAPVAAGLGMPGVGGGTVAGMAPTAGGLVSPGAGAFAAPMAGPPGAGGGAMAAAQMAGAKLGAPAPPVPGLSPPGAGVSGIPGVTAPAPNALALAQQELTPPERQALVQDSTPFLKLGMDIASGTLSLG